MFSHFHVWVSTISTPNPQQPPKRRISKITGRPVKKKAPNGMGAKQVRYPHLKRHIPRAHVRGNKPGTKKQTGGHAASAFDVMRRFGGPSALCKAMEKAGVPRAMSVIYKWLYPYPKGMAGRVPYNAWLDIQVAAKVAGVDLTNIKTMPVRKGKGVARASTHD